MEANGVQKVPSRIGRDALNDALAPLYELLGTDKSLLFDLKVTPRWVTVTLAGHVDTSASALSVKVGKGEFAERGTVVHIPIRDGQRDERPATLATECAL